MTRQEKIKQYCEKYFLKIEYIVEHEGFDIRHGQLIVDYDDGGNISNLKRIYNDRPSKSVFPLDR